MRRIFIISGVLILVFASGKPHSFADGRQQARAMGDQMRRHDLVGIPVQDLQGNEVGQVVALTAKNDEVAYFLVALNGGEGELTPIPFSAARFDPQTNVVVLLDVEDAELAQGPAIIRDEMERPDNLEFDSRSRSYYGQEFPQEEESEDDLNSEEGMELQEKSGLNI